MAGQIKSPHEAGGKEFAMEKKLWISAEGNVMIGDQRLPRCKILSLKGDNSRSEAYVVFEAEVEKLDIDFMSAIVDGASVTEHAMSGSLGSSHRCLRLANTVMRSSLGISGRRVVRAALKLLKDAACSGDIPDLILRQYSSYKRRSTNL